MAISLSAEGKELQKIQIPDELAGGLILAVAGAPDGQTFVLAGDRSGATRNRVGWLALFEIATGRLINHWQFPGAINHVVFTPDGKSLIFDRWSQQQKIHERLELFDLAASAGSTLFQAPSGPTATAQKANLSNRHLPGRLRTGRRGDGK